MQTFTVVLLVSLFTMAVGPTVGFAASTDSIAMSCVAGATGSIRVSVEPIRMREESDKHFIDFSIESRLAAATKSRVVHYVAFSRADGSQFQPPVESMVVALTDTRPGHTHSLTAALPSVDGTYLVRVFTASVSEGDQQSLITDLPVSVSGGQVYIGHDQVGLAQRQAEQVGKPPVTNACPINNPDCGPGGDPDPPDPPPPTGNYTGTVTGRLLFWNSQGNFCPGGRVCTGAKYLASAFNTALPVRGARVSLRKGASTYGNGFTDDNGYFSFRYSRPKTVSGSGQRIEAQAVSNTGRYILKADGGIGDIVQNVGSVNMSNANINHNAGTFQIGNSQMTADARWNVFDGARRAWDSLSRSSRMVAFFPQVKVWTFSNDCLTSCASGTEGFVKLDPNAGFAPQARILHELGHI